MASDVTNFKAPAQSLGSLDADAAARLITAAADVALVVDAHGVIQDIAFGASDAAIEGGAEWVGRPWTDTVTLESRPKVEALLRDAAGDAAPRWRQVTHSATTGVDVPILYSAIKIGRRGRVLALGRDLRSVATLQQRLLDTQRSMELEYSRLRQAETRYRLLFQLGAEAVLILEAGSQKVVESNPAAVRILGETSKRVTGRVFPYGLDVDSTTAVQSQLDKLKAAGRADEVVVRVANGAQRFVLSMSLFRHESSTFCLARLSALAGDARAAAGTPVRSRLLEVVDRLPDGFVVTDLDGRVLTANPAFLDLAQLGSEEQARGELLSRWLGRPGVDLEVLLKNLIQHGSIRLFSTTVLGQFGSSAEVEISAVAVPSGEQPCLGFTLRYTGPRQAPVARPGRQLPRSMEQLTELIGRVPLKDLVRDTTDVIERMCIEAALELTKDNRASAAEMLGLSRQSLYVKLRRFGLSDADDLTEAADPAP